MLEIWGRVSSSNVQALMWCVSELGLEYERHDAGLHYGVNDTPEYLAMNPNGTVPVMRDGGGVPLFESGAMIRYLTNQYGKAPFWPETLAEQTLVDMWAEWAKINIALGFTAPIFWKVVRTAPSKQDSFAIGDAVAVFEKKLRIGEARLTKNDYLAGRAFTPADIMFGHILYRYFDIDIERADMPAVKAYYERLTQRPAFREHVMVSYEELRVAD